MGRVYNENGGQERRIIDNTKKPRIGNVLIRVTVLNEAQQSDVGTSSVVDAIGGLPVHEDSTGKHVMHAADLDVLFVMLHELG